MDVIGQFVTLRVFRCLGRFVKVVIFVLFIIRYFSFEDWDSASVDVMEHFIRCRVLRLGQNVRLSMDLRFKQSIICRVLRLGQNVISPMDFR